MRTGPAPTRPSVHPSTHPRSTVPTFRQVLSHARVAPGTPRRQHADDGLLFGSSALPCLWAAMACRADSIGRRALLLQFRLSLGGGLLLLLLLSVPPMSRGVHAAALTCGALSAAGLGLGGLLGELLRGAAFGGACWLLFEGGFRFLPRCFTLGEAAFIAQGLASVVYAALCTLVPTVDQQDWLRVQPSWSAGSVPLEVLAVLCTSTLTAAGLLALVCQCHRTSNAVGDSHGKDANDAVTDGAEPPWVVCTLAIAAAGIYTPWVLKIMAAIQPTDAGSTWEWLASVAAADDFRCAYIFLYWMVAIVRNSDLRRACPVTQQQLPLSSLTACAQSASS